MMGRQDNQKTLFSYSVDLDKHVRPENPLRQVSDYVSPAQLTVAALNDHDGDGTGGRE